MSFDLKCQIWQHCNIPIYFAHNGILYKNAIIKGLIGLVKGIPCVDKVYDLKTDIAKACQEDLSIYLKGTEPHHFYMMRCSILLDKV